MRIVVFSDTHGNIRHCIDVIDRIGSINMIIHLGDIIKDVEDLKILYPHIPIQYIAGNNEFRNTVPYDKVLEADGKKIFITHGHLYRVKYEYHSIARKGADLHVDCVLFGHTHEPYEAYHDKMHIMNPGSISLPRRGKPSYGVIEIEQGKLRTCICNIV
ncbi:metallophosphoesterase [Petroclostridium sp. X23]|uniref:metallophosphoesterase n=1 Tax=Petroclostridium sp. X23 TaxID=3045146 RepID=UPI0024AE20C7|nr:metallophosphoesterase [Petroclostridium sp. X23]WHH57092.1 metallophosphoesterase [Petroclostridium sp. X23]